MDNDAILKFFKAISNSERLDMIKLLKKKELCGQEIQAKFFMEQSTISHHLNLLKKAGILKDRRAGRNIYYSVDIDGVQDILKSIEPDLVFF